MPDIGTELVAIVRPSLDVSVLPFFIHYQQLEEEFRYLQRKKNVVKELAEVRLKVVFIITFKPCYSDIVSLEHYIFVEPHQIPGGAYPPYPPYVQSMSGRFFRHKCGKSSVVARRLWQIFTEKRRHS